MSNPLDDAETFKTLNGFLIELGKKTINLNEIEAQYIGLFKISKNYLQNFLDYGKSIN